MGETNLKRKKLKQKSIWPSIAFFVVFLICALMLLSYATNTFIVYVINAKISELEQQAAKVSLLIDQRLEEGNSIENAIKTPERMDEDESIGQIDTIMSAQAVYVTDEDGNLVVSTGDSSPYLESAVYLLLGTEWTLYEDSKVLDEKGNTLDQLLDIDYSQMIKWFLEEDVNHVGQKQWLQNVVMNQMFWLKKDLDNTDLNVYVMCELEIKRQDLLSIGVFGFFAIVLVMLPILFLLINTIVTILRQQRTTRILYTDTVTNGHNWIWFENHMTNFFKRGIWKNKTFALVNLEIVRFKQYCAYVGDKEAEVLLQNIDGYLMARMVGTDSYAHHSDEDFAILIQCEGTTLEEQKEYAEQKVRSFLAELSGIKSEQNITFHAGIYMIEPGPERKNLDINEIYHYANFAIQRKRKEKETKIFFFDGQMIEEHSWTHFVEDHMENALAQEEFEVYLQPKYNPQDERIIGAEALVRWNSPEKGLLSPARFISLFEENGFITKLDDYMISQVAKMQAEWSIQKKKQVPISVNISRAHFAQEGLAAHISQLVDAYGAKHELIELEVTESAFFDDKDILIETVKELKELGFYVSMDDFGAGYSSLNSLKDIPLDVLKLDGEFFRGDDSMGRGKIVVKEAIQLARNLNMRIVAEGIERKDQVDFLAEQGCDMIQGFYFAKPMPVSDYVQLMEANA